MKSVSFSILPVCILIYMFVMVLRFLREIENEINNSQMMLQSYTLGVEPTVAKDENAHGQLIDAVLVLSEQVVRCRPRGRQLPIEVRNWI